MKRLPLILVANNIRSAYNVGSLFRTGEGAGIERLVLCGIAPHPRVKNDFRPPYVVEKDTKAIAKTALGAENQLPFDYFDSTHEAITCLKQAGYFIYALEQSEDSQSLFKVNPKYPMALVLGQERGGVGADILAQCDGIIEVPMFGQKDSLNVASAASATLFWLRGQYENMA